MNVKNRSFVIGALVDIPGPEQAAEGVLFAHGTRFGGHALYVKDNRLHYVNSYVGAEEQMVVGSEDVPTGDDLILSASFEKTGQDPQRLQGNALALPRRDEGGRGDDQDTARGLRDRRRGPLRRPPRGRAGHPGLPRRAAVLIHGRDPPQVSVNVSGEPYLDLERHAQMLLKAQ